MSKHALTDAAIREARPRERAYKLYDSGGLYLLVNPSGSKLWRMKYRVRGASGRAEQPRNSREKLLPLGSYPAISLKKARLRRNAARAQLEEGRDPAELRRAERLAQANRPELFGAVLTEWWDRKLKKLAPSTRKRDERILKRIKKRLQHRPLVEIDTPEILSLLRSIEVEGKYETASRARRQIGEVFAYAIAAGKALRDASSGLERAIAAPVTASYAAITNPKELSELLKAIDGYPGQPATAAALKLLPLVFTRPGELRQARWSEFDLDGGQWVVPAERMKLRREHVVPLARQTVAILRDLEAVTGRGELVFPSLRPARPLSENTLNVALRTLGYNGKKHVAHGFRSTASTLLHELGYSPEVIETQLAHARPGVAGVYNRSHLLEQRRTMMQGWADYLETLKTERRVVPIGRRRSRRS